MVGVLKVRINQGFFSTNLMSKFWMFFLLTHMFLSITLHSTTLWLAVFISFARNMALKGARLNSKWQNPYLAVGKNCL